MAKIEVREEVELLPCPFCGWDEPSITYNAESADVATRTEPRVRIQCGRPLRPIEGMCTAGINGTASEAARQWNRRPPVATTRGAVRDGSVLGSPFK